jgi:hypothetical protein
MTVLVHHHRPLKPGFPTYDPQKSSNLLERILYQYPFVELNVAKRLTTQGGYYYKPSMAYFAFLSKHKKSAN